MERKVKQQIKHNSSNSSRIKWQEIEDEAEESRYEESVYENQNQQSFEQPFIPSASFSITNQLTQHTLTTEDAKLNQFLVEEFTGFVCQFVDKISTLETTLKQFKKYIEINKIQCFSMQNNTKLRLYFLAKKIIIQGTKLQILKQIIDEKYDSGVTQSYILNRNKYERCLIYIPNPAPNKKHQFFQIKSIDKAAKPNYDSDHLVDTLFNLYVRLCQRFNYLASILLYWAYYRGILKPKYLSENAFKMLILVYLNVHNVPNIIDTYRLDYKQQLESISKCKELGKGGKWNLNQQLLNNFANKFIVEKKNGFKLKNNQFDTMPFIHTIDFPQIETEAEKIIKKLAPQAKKFFNSKCIGAWVYNFFKDINSIFEKNDSLKVDLGSSKTGIYIISKSDLDSQTLTIIHPVYRHNLTENLKRRQDFQVVKKQFYRAYNLMRQGTTESAINLCAPYS